MIGKLVLFEGGEGGGKTTQLNNAINRIYSTGLISKFQDLGRDVVVTKEPGGTDLGKEIRKILLESTVERSPIVDELLLAADRANHVEKFLMPHLKAGHIVLCDRYIATSIAYGVYGRKINREVLNYLLELTTGGLRPDLTIWLDVDPEVGLERAKQRGKLNRIDQFDLEFHRRVQRGFEQAAANDPNFIHIDATKDIHVVEEEIWNVLTRHFKTWFNI